MADITMCEGRGCEIKHTCYRHKAEPNKYRQSYFTESPIKDSGCEYYWSFEMFLRERATTVEGFDSLPIF